MVAAKRDCKPRGTAKRDCKPRGTAKRDCKLTVGLPRGNANLRDPNITCKITASWTAASNWESISREDICRESTT